MTDLPVIQQRGQWFDELQTGVIYRHAPGRTIAESDNIAFTTMTMNPQSLHLDAAASAETEFGQRLVNSLLTMSVLVGLYGETEILDKRPSKSRPGQGVVTFRHVAKNQHDEVVAVITRSTLMRSAPEES